tara:strand:- start:2245 stop:2571 length:327 start_codon:yes stop_codon:yes gene_type:complete
MANAYKVLGQVADASANNVTLIADQNGETIVSTIVIANREAAVNTFRIAVRPAAATLANEHYIAYDASVAANDTITLTLGLTLADNDIVTVGASDDKVSFSAFGTVIT